MFCSERYKMVGRLEGKHVLITGGGSGMGLTSARDFAKEGGRVAICGWNPDTLKKAQCHVGDEIDRGGPHV
jgi:NAD(P)-dependent dehydrogenase (short-subunit alcohol dehydrogenase family)